MFQRFRQVGLAQHGVVSHWSIDEANFPNTFEVMVMLLQRHTHWTSPDFRWTLSYKGQIEVTKTPYRDDDADGL